MQTKVNDDVPTDAMIAQLRQKLAALKLEKAELEKQLAESDVALYKARAKYTTKNK